MDRWDRFMWNLGRASAWVWMLLKGGR